MEYSINEDANYLPCYIVDNRYSYRKGVTINDELITSIETTNYLNLNGALIAIISIVDAEFLYRSKRIEKFITFQSNNEFLNKLKVSLQSLGISLDDLVVV